MEFAIIVVHVLAALGITGLVLIQQGKGADMGASFGSGASQTIFGSAGSGNVLTKSTSWLAVIFIVTSLGLAMLARQQADRSIETNSLIENVEQLDNLLNTQSAGAAGDIPQVSGQDDLDAALEAVAGQVEAEAATVQEEAASVVDGQVDTLENAQLIEQVDELENTAEEIPEAVEQLPAQ